VFNHSIIEPLRKSSASKELVQTLAGELKQAEQTRLSAIAVSDDGMRIAKRFGMSKVGFLVIAGSDPEHVFARC